MSIYGLGNNVQILHEQVSTGGRTLRRVVEFGLMLDAVYTVLYQMPEVSGIGGARYVLFALWGLTFGLCLLLGRPRIHTIVKQLAVLVIAFDSYCILLDLCKESGYTSSPLFYNMNMTFFFILFGNLAVEALGRESAGRICKAYALPVLAITPYFVVNYFFAGRAYVSKNSLGPILVFGVIILAAGMSFKNRFAEALRWTFTAFLAACVLASYNRSSMVSLVVLALYYALVVQRTQRSRLIACGVLVAIAIVCASSPQIMNVLRASAMTNLASKGVDELSRGRVSLLHSGWQTFLDNPLFGVGRSYVENFHCSVLVHVGILGSVPVFLMYLYPIYAFTANRRLIRADSFALLVALMVLLGAVGSIFDEQAPIGPGTSFFIIWLFVGYFERHRPGVDRTWT